MTGLKKKDFVSDQEVRWCPGCGDYSILASIQMAMTKLGRDKEDIVFISGIGCSSRFPYYMNTYGMHSIHGRAPAFATGLKSHNPNLSVWIITGDGDSLSIGGNHFIHLIRRNVNLNIIIFNNEIYGLTKGQYSPTSHPGLVTKSTPYGSIDRSFNPSSLAIGAGASFFARTMDTDVKHMQEIFLEAEAHQGTSVIEVFQNCVIFNDKVHDEYTNRKLRQDSTLQLSHGEPMIYGSDKNMGIVMEGGKLKSVTVGENGVAPEHLLKHDKHDTGVLAYMLGQLKTPMPMGVFCQNEHSTYESDLHNQLNSITTKVGAGSMKDLLHSGDTWIVS